MHKNPFEPQAPDHLEKLAESLLYNFHREHILLKYKKSYRENLVLKTLQLEFSVRNIRRSIISFQAMWIMKGTENTWKGWKLI